MYAQISVTDQTRNPSDPHVIEAEDFDDLIDALRDELETIAEGLESKLARKVTRTLNRLNELDDEHIDGHDIVVDDGAAGVRLHVMTF